MTAQEVTAEGLGDSRPRPQVHFTADDGWINDPYGVTWVKDRYHLFYQAIPGRVTWAPNCHWGHAESFDLVHWTEQPMALAPQPFEVGCWSGTFVMNGDAPTILYTRVSGDDWGQGRVAMALGDPTATVWATGLDDVVIDGPPAGMGVHAFRDPYIFRTDAGWAMIMAAGLDNGSGAALQYRSADLVTWTYDGVLCSRPGRREDDVWTGALWECPQLFPLGNRWVLLVSVWDADVLHYVAAAVGDYDGTTFTPQTWQRLTYGDSAYAMSSFTDKDGRRCVLSWLREEPQNNPDLTRRAGAHSVVATLHLDDAGVLSLAPHANLESAGGGVVPGQATAHGTVYHAPAAAADIRLKTDGLRAIVVSDGETVRARIILDAVAARLFVERDPLGPGTLPLPEVSAPHELRIIIDADLLEVFTAISYGAYRLEPSVGSRNVTVSLEGVPGVVGHLRPLK
jgi:beta-fructofuranosidase